MRARAILATIFIAGLVAGATPSPAAAADGGPILVSDENRVTPTEVDNDEATASVAIANPGDATVDVTIDDAPAHCTITPDPPKLEGHQQQNVKLTFKGCNDKGVFDFTLIAGDQSFKLTATQSAAPNPNWTAVGKGYGGAALAALILLAISYWTWSPPQSRTRKWFMPLPGIAATWKFTDSWAANATVLTALFAGVFGVKEVVNALLGQQGSTNVFAVALVCGAISVGLVGISPMVLQVLRKRVNEADAAETDKDGKSTLGKTPAGLYVTPIGLVSAGLVTLAATGGQLISILYTVGKTNFWNDGALWGIGIVSGLLLLTYAFISTHQNLATGALLPKPDEKKEEPDEQIAKAAAALWQAAADGKPVKISEQEIKPETVLAMLPDYGPERAQVDRTQTLGSAAADSLREAAARGVSIQVNGTEIKPETVLAMLPEETAPLSVAPSAVPPQSPPSGIL